MIRSKEKDDPAKENQKGKSMLALGYRPNENRNANAFVCIEETKLEG